MNKTVSIIIPAYNASAVLKKNVPPFLTYLRSKKISFEMIIVDDGSADQNKSRQIAKNLGCRCISYRQNKGKGYALRRGALSSTGQYLIFTDADIPFAYRDYYQIISDLKGNQFDMVIGDRTLPDSTYFHKIPFTRQIGSAFFSFLAGGFISGGFYDTQCGLKGFNTAIGKDLFKKSTIHRFGIDVELLYLALKEKLRIKRIPVHLRCNDSSSVHLYSDGIRMLFDLMSIPFKYFLRVYSRVHSDFEKNKDVIQIEGGYQYNAYYHGNPMQRFWHYAKYSQAMRLLSIKDKARILDVGCGSGVLSYLIAQKYPHVIITGIDSNTKAIQFCKKKYHLPNLHFQEGFVEKLPFKKESIDGILFLEVVEHIYPSQAQKTFKQFYSLLKKNGTLVVSTPNYAGFWPLIEFVLDIFRLVPHLHESQHVAKYTKSTLLRLGTQNGFTKNHIYSVNFLAPLMNVVSTEIAQYLHVFEVSREQSLGNVLVGSFKK